MVFHHGVQHAGRRQRLGLAQRGFRGAQGRCVSMATLRRIERRRNRCALRDQLGAPLGQTDLLATALKLQAGLAAARSHPVLVARQRGDFLRRVGRAVGQQAVQQKHIEKTHGVGGDADRHKRIQVHQPHFDIFHTAFAQRMQGPLAGENHAFRPDGAVKLVFNLQQAGGELVVVAAGVLDADRLISRVGPGQCVLQ